jgi:ribosomal protein L40E
MIRYVCDRCGARMGPNDPQRYIVKLEVYAAAGHVDLSDEAPQDIAGELDRVMESLATADPDEIEDQTYRAFRFDVCDRCRVALLADPLRRETPPAR